MDFTCHGTPDEEWERDSYVSEPYDPVSPYYGDPPSPDRSVPYEPVSPYYGDPPSPYPPQVCGQEAAQNSPHPSSSSQRLPSPNPTASTPLLQCPHGISQVVQPVNSFTPFRHRPVSPHPNIPESQPQEFNFGWGDDEEEMRDDGRAAMEQRREYNCPHGFVYSSPINFHSSHARSSMGHGLSSEFDVSHTPRMWDGEREEEEMGERSQMSIESTRFSTGRSSSLSTFGGSPFSSRSDAWGEASDRSMDQGNLAGRSVGWNERGGHAGGSGRNFDYQNRHGWGRERSPSGDDFQQQRRDSGFSGNDVGSGWEVTIHREGDRSRRDVRYGRRNTEWNGRGGYVRGRGRHSNDRNQRGSGWGEDSRRDSRDGRRSRGWNSGLNSQSGWKRRDNDRREKERDEDGDGRRRRSHDGDGDYTQRRERSPLTWDDSAVNIPSTVRVGEFATVGPITMTSIPTESFNKRSVAAAKDRIAEIELDRRNYGTHIFWKHAELEKAENAMPLGPERDARIKELKDAIQEEKAHSEWISKQTKEEKMFVKSLRPEERPLYSEYLQSSARNYSKNVQNWLMHLPTTLMGRVTRNRVRYYEMKYTTDLHPPQFVRDEVQTWSRHKKEKVELDRWVMKRCRLMELVGQKRTWSAIEKEFGEEGRGVDFVPVMNAFRILHKSSADQNEDDYRHAKDVVRNAIDPAWTDPRVEEEEWRPPKRRRNYRSPDDHRRELWRLEAQNPATHGADSESDFKEKKPKMEEKCEEPTGSVVNGAVKEELEDDEVVIIAMVKGKGKK